ncbi:MAG: hypothetical protein AB7S26_19750 [Sandaracinaceae bacterium]
MTRRLSRAVLALFIVALSASATAQAPTSAPAFAAPVTYQRCTESWAFACGMRDAEGRTYGTAHRQTHCTRYTFAPDGTVHVDEPFPGVAPIVGRYRIERGALSLQLLDEEGHVTTRETLALSDDGSTLGDLRRVEPQPPPVSEGD